ncbi:adenylyl-sulfate kinase [Pyxidicoccus sp. 3LFB2]
MRQSAGFILWLTGLSGAGKSTLSRALHAQLEPLRAVELLDGDEVRTWLSRGLGFSREDREENVRRIGKVAMLLGRHGVGVIVAAISPYRSSRDEVRRMATAQGIPFVEVYMHTGLDTLIARDVKGLYKKALAGELPHFTGVSDPYEAPESPEAIVRSDVEPVEAGLARVLDVLRASGLVASSAA